MMSTESPLEKKSCFETNVAFWEWIPIYDYA